jgi:hypothetical protein
VEGWDDCAVVLVTCREGFGAAGEEDRLSDDEPHPEIASTASPAAIAA